MIENIHSCKQRNPLTLESLGLLNLGTDRRNIVSNAGPDESNGRQFFDIGLRLFYAYQHELAAQCFLACIQESPDCAIAYCFVALCHSPNYNYNREPYYSSTSYPENERNLSSDATDSAPLFPSQQFAEKYSRMAADKVENLRKLVRRKKGGSGRRKKISMRRLSLSDECDDAGDSDSSQVLYPSMITDIETQIISATRALTCHPGIDGNLAEETVGRPYANALRKLYSRYPDDPDVSYLFAESLMILNAWQLYDYPTGRPLSSDVIEIRSVLEASLAFHPEHVGLCHLYIHLCEMSSNPAQALSVCEALKRKCIDTGHLVHMATHIDVLMGDYESCVIWNAVAIEADKKVSSIFREMAGPPSFYFGYLIHNYHMLVYGAILGAYQEKALTYARELNEVLTEEFFQSNLHLVNCLESYAALDIHVLVRFGNWDDVLCLPSPKNEELMLYRSAMLMGARAIAFANKKNVPSAKSELRLFENIEANPETKHRILHNNTVDRLLEVERFMIKGEIAYFEGKSEESFVYLRESVKLQDNLNYDEPWGKMQPVHHALGALLLKEGLIEEAESTFRVDLKYRPRNPWGLLGLLNCLKLRINKTKTNVESLQQEIELLSSQFSKQRSSDLADYQIVRSCECAR